MLQDKKERMILRSASAPSPPTAQVVPPEPEEGSVEMFMGELGKIDEAMMVRGIGLGWPVRRVGRAVMMMMLDLF